MTKIYISLKKLQKIDNLAKYNGVTRSALLRVMIDFFIKEFEADFKEAEQWCIKQEKRAKV